MNSLKLIVVRLFLISCIWCAVFTQYCGGIVDIDSGLTDNEIGTFRRYKDGSLGRELSPEEYSRFFERCWRDDEIYRYYHPNGELLPRYAEVERNIESESRRKRGCLYVMMQGNHSWFFDGRDKFVVGDCCVHAIQRLVHQFCLIEKEKDSESFSDDRIRGIVEKFSPWEIRKRFKKKSSRTRMSHSSQISARWFHRKMCKRNIGRY